MADTKWMIKGRGARCPTRHVLRRLLLGSDGAVVRSGVMNVLWIAAITIFVLTEKVVPAGRAISRIAGLFAWGAWLLTDALL
jgi:hypothetical protein